MVRQKSRKGIEELYGSTKFDTTKSPVTNTAMPKNARIERDYNGYIIQSNTPFSSMPLPPGVSFSGAVPNATPASSRRKTMTTARPLHMRGESSYVMDGMKKDQTQKTKGLTTCRLDKTGAYSGAHLCDNKNCLGCGDTHANNVKDLHQNARHQHHRHQHIPAGRDDEKEDDADEFFDLIKHTVESAVGRTVSELLNRNFRDLSAKIDRFSTELKSTNTLLNKLQTDINHKIVHYGEENSRHFRYLCMKSEYDKMFYQHHTSLNTNGETSTNDLKQQASNRHIGDMVTETKNQPAPCTCRGSSSHKMSEATAHKPQSDEVSLSQKSSDVGMREVLEHIQRFCTQIQLSDMQQSNEHVSKSNNNYRGHDPMEGIKVHKKLFEEMDEDESPISSDGMTPRSSLKYGGNTMRSGLRSSVGQGLGEGDN